MSRKCEERKDMVHAASEWMNDAQELETRSLSIHFEDGSVAAGKFSALEDSFFTFLNSDNPGNGTNNSSDTAWRKEDYPYCSVLKIVRDYYREYRDAGE